MKHPSKLEGYRHEPLDSDSSFEDKITLAWYLSWDKDSFLEAWKNYVDIKVGDDYLSDLYDSKYEHSHKDPLE